MFSYNTSYHRSIRHSPYFLTYGLEPRQPGFPEPDLRRLHENPNPATDLVDRLQQARIIAAQDNLIATEKNKAYFDKKAAPHTFHENHRECAYKNL